MGFSVGGLNISSFLAGLERAKVDVTDAASAGLGDAAEYILSLAVQQVPIEEGMLSDSGRTEVDGLRAAVGFGFGPSAAYAVRQHEDMTLHHDPGRKAQYLADPVKDSAAAVNRIIGERIKRAL